MGRSTKKHFKISQNVRTSVFPLTSSATKQYSICHGLWSRTQIESPFSFQCQLPSLWNCYWEHYFEKISQASCKFIKRQWQQSRWGCAILLETKRPVFQGCSDRVYMNFSEASQTERIQKGTSVFFPLGCFASIFFLSVHVWNHCPFHCSYQ